MDVSVSTGIPETDTGAAFVAGVAATQAQDATNTARSAEMTAEDAMSVASSAAREAAGVADTATEAELSAHAAHERLDALVGSFHNFQDGLLMAMNANSAADDGDDDGAPPLGEENGHEDQGANGEPAPTPTKAKKASHWWFGDR
jgi:hypothetical protein